MIKTYVICLLAGIIGQGFHLLIRISALKKRAQVANISTFSIAQYFKDDSLPNLLNIVALLIEIFLLDEIAKPYPVVMDYLKFFYLTLGYMGSSLLSSVLSKSEDKINKIVDHKTDQADGKI